MEASRAGLAGSRHVFLVGLSGVGKTTLAPRVASLLNLPWLDTDTLVEDREGASIAGLFDTHGEAYFRKVEAEVVDWLLTQPPHVVAMGGGAPCRPGVMAQLLNAGVVLYLDASDDLLATRLSHGAPRPLISRDDAVGALSRLRVEREAVYAQAHATLNIEGHTLTEVARRLATRAQEWLGD